MDSDIKRKTHTRLPPGINFTFTKLKKPKVLGDIPSVQYATHTDDYTEFASLLDLLASFSFLEAQLWVSVI